jgi:hypothetical protein
LCARGRRSIIQARAKIGDEAVKGLFVLGAAGENGSRVRCNRIQNWQSN